MFFVLLEQVGYNYSVSGPFNKISVAEEACIAALRSGALSAKIIRKSQLSKLSEFLSYQANNALIQMAKIQTQTKNQEYAKPTI